MELQLESVFVYLSISNKFFDWSWIKLSFLILFFIWSSHNSHVISYVFYLWINRQFAIFNWKSKILICNDFPYCTRVFVNIANGFSYDSFQFIVHIIALNLCSVIYFDFILQNKLSHRCEDINKEFIFQYKYVKNEY